ncbi:multiple inositol polyphosphate phosphatase 1 [Pantherophis guttatus]|uniref:Multiple inositol polyphosphate phosphatase 1 n=1 Tax=Pantherophis guttatus TaxID=94885 RepID=A0A6P9CG35_PANGU|nr:multiple inositol polyphosphate phosphatase 1 [Pantherophis guttatus]
MLTVGEEAFQRLKRHAERWPFWRRAGNEGRGLPPCRGVAAVLQPGEGNKREAGGGSEDSRSPPRSGLPSFSAMWCPATRPRFVPMLQLLLLLLANGELQGDAEAAERATLLSPFFGTKSRYEELHPYLLRDPLSLGPPLSGFPLPPASCTPLQLSAVMRHGTRFPTRKQIEKLASLHGLLRGGGGGKRCSVAERLARWEMWYQPSMDGKLAPKGFSDMGMLAKRLASRFPSLLAPGRRLAFTSSSKHRCVDSSKAFREGLREALMSGGGKNVTLTETFEINDKLMRFFDHCEKFVRDVEDNDTAMHEVDAFKESPEMMKVVNKTTHTLCLPAEDLNADLVQVAFFTCSFGLSIKNISSPWCSLFNKEDAKALEYLNDLKQYWKRAYGYNINSQSSCILLQDIFKNLDKAVSESKRSKPISSPVIIQFGHAETLQPLLSLMGYFKDKVPLNARNYRSQSKRKFRSGRIVPYAANLLFVLYHCDQARSPKDEYKVQILLNEKLLPFTYSGKTVSLYTKLKNHYKYSLQNCEFAKVCSIKKNGTSIKLL